MRALLARCRYPLALAAVSVCWAQPTISSLQSSTLQAIAPSNVTAITSGTTLVGGGMRLYINGNFPNTFQNVTWTNTSTNVATTFVGNVSVTTTQLILTIPNALFAALVSGPVTVNVTVQDNIGVSNIAHFTINPPLVSVGPALPSGTLNQSYPDTLYVSGGTAPFVVLPGGILPPGIALDATGNGVVGTPTQTGVFGFVPTITDFWGNGLQLSIAIEVVGVPTLISMQPSSAAAGSGPVTITLVGTQFVPPQQIPGGSIPGTVAQWTVLGVASVPLNSLLTNAGSITATIPANLLTTPVVALLTVQQPSGVSSNALSFTVTGPTTTSAPSYGPSASVAVGTAVTISTTVSGAGTINGTATFSENGVTIGSGTVFNLSASFTTSALAPGVHNIVATYGGDATHTGSASTASTLIVIGVPTLISILPSSAPAGSPAVTITVTGTNFLPIAQGTAVRWFINGVNPLQLVTTVTSSGSLTATIPANLLATPVLASISVVQPNGVASTNALPFAVMGPTTISAPQYTPSNTVAAGTPVTMTSTIQGAGTVTGTVTFSENSTTIGTGTVANLSANVTTSTLPLGVHNILATYSGDSIHTGNSSVASILTVGSLASLSSLSPASILVGSNTFTLTVNGNNFVAGSVVTFNGTQLATTSVSGVQLIAVVPNTLLTNVATVPVLVVNPSFGSSPSLPFSIVAPTLAINTTALPATTAGAPYNAALSASGGVPPYTWTISGLPPGIGSNAATGVINGAALVGGSFPVTIVVRDFTNVTASKTLSLTVNGPPVQLPSTGGGLPNGTVGVVYAAFISATGGATPYTFSLLGGGLPAGLSLASSGFISGTPTTPGRNSFGVQVTDSGGVTSSGQFSITILPGPLSLGGGVSGTGSSGTVGTPLNIVFTGAGGVPPYSVNITGSLPPGTSATGGVLSGTPTTAGSYTIRVVLGDTTGSSVTQSVTIVIAPAPVSLTIGGSLANGQVGVAYSGQLSAAGGTPPYNFTGTGLPAGLSLSGSGALTGTPTASGNFVLTATVTDSALLNAAHSGSARFPFTIAPAAAGLTVTTLSLPNAVVNAVYSASLAASGGTAPYTWTVTGLPSGVTATAAGVLSGVPTTAGSYTVKASVTDQAGASGSQSYAVTVAPAPLTITTTSAPNGAVGTAYAATIAATGGVSPYTFTATGLPAGLAISNAGAITGTPTAPGSAALAVTVKDSTGTAATKSFPLTIALPAAPPLNVTGISATSPPLQQPVVQVSLGNTYPVDVAVTLTLTFAPDSGADDPTIQFSTGGRVANITVPAGSLNGLTTAGVQTGSVAGVITITASMQAAGVDVTPSPAPVRTIRIAALAPVPTTVTATRTSTGFTVTVIGFVTDREITQAIFTFTAAAGANLQTTTLTVPVGPFFATYFGGSTATPFGGQFNFAETFTVTGSNQAITAVAVVLVNNVGQSTSGSATLN